MRLFAAIEPDQVMQAAVAVIVVLVVVAFLAMRFIQKMVLKLVMVAALAGAGLFLYSQRSSLDDCQEQVRASVGRDCICGFAGFDLTVPGCDRVPGG